MLVGLSVLQSAAQCPTTISSFPFTEDFENSDGGWIINGGSPDWAWGTPSKPVINSAGSGLKCWVTGGLTGSSYNDGEASWIQSPCFNFSSLQNPVIACKVFWEMEQRFDGAGFQYSTDNGTTWNNVGSVSDASNCLNENWFNNSSITYLNWSGPNREGWSGNRQTTSGSCQGGNGSNGWVTAKHLVPSLAGQPNVIFRFTFGAGTQCNAFDGFGVDSFSVSEAPPNIASFDYTCNANAVSFISTSTPCPDIFNWDFGDPASGTKNTASVVNPVHAFSAPGDYTVTLTVNGPANIPSTTTRTIRVLGATASVLSQVRCGGEASGSATVIAAGGNNYSYAWSTNPVQTSATATGLLAGAYTVEVSEPNACGASAVVTITEPAPVTGKLNVIKPVCGGTTGSISVEASGGTPGYTYLWQPAVSTTQNAADIPAGNYSVTITDTRNCSRTLSAGIIIPIPPVVEITSFKEVSCMLGNDGTATAGLIAGNGTSFGWSWNSVPPQSGSTAKKLVPGTYTVTVTDDNGCSGNATVMLTQTDDCTDIYFPSSFSPNGDARNELFGPLGDLASVSDYIFAIYNRFGQLLFTSTNPFEKWSGYCKGVQCLPGSYVWYATYKFKGNQQVRSRKGSLVLIR